MWRLDGKRVLVGVSGGIAAYKSAELVRGLVSAGAEVRVMMTRNAQEFITALTLQTLSGNAVATDTFSLTQESEIGHIRLADTADAIIIAPATADVVAKLAHGLADDLLTTVLLATRAPVVIAPAMNVHMWENPLVQANLSRLREAGMQIVEPGAGFLACGYEGKGRLADVEELIEAVRRALTPAKLAGERLLITAGPNREAIDPVRFISNRSTGKMGFALAAAAARRGADVVLVAGPVALPAPLGVRRIDVTTANEMLAAVEHEFPRATVLVMTAAVADYRPATVAKQKIKKSEGGLTVDLVRNPDILAKLAQRKGKRFFVGFAAETNDVLRNAQRKLAAKKIDLMVANDVSRADAGFAVDTNAVTLLGADGSCEELPLMPKDEVAEAIVDRIVSLRQFRRSKR